MSSDESCAGKYMITVPQPSGGKVFGPITAESRMLALYVWASRGGFVLEESRAGLTIWTLEEWEEAVRKFPMTTQPDEPAGEKPL